MQYRERVRCVASFPHGCTYHCTTYHHSHCGTTINTTPFVDTTTYYYRAGRQLSLGSDCPMGPVWRCWVHGLHDVCVGIDLFEAERLLLSVYLGGER